MAKGKAGDKPSKGADQTLEGDSDAEEQAEEAQARGGTATDGKRKGAGGRSRSRQRHAAGAVGKNKTVKEVKKENALDDAEMYMDLDDKKNSKKKAVVDLRASAQRSLMNTAEQQLEANMKLSRKKRNQQKMKRFAETIGVEDNNSYPKCKDRERLIINVSTSKYFVVRFVAKHLFNFRLSFKALEDVHAGFNYEALVRPSQQGQEEDWDIYWTDNGVQPERIARMKPYQKTNHFPGMFQLSRKNHLARNLIKMSKKFPKEYKFFPRTFLLPAEWGDFKNSFSNKSANMRPIYIVKPEASCQGKGIFLVDGPEDVKENDHYVVQQYIKKPLLIEGLKFDCRLYVLVLSVDPLRVYLFKEGLARFSTDRYQAPCRKNLANLFMHLTNYSINSKNKGVFQFNKNLDEVDTGHKRTFSSILDWICENFEDGERKKEKMLLQIEQIIIRTLCTVQPSLKHYLQIPNKAQYINDGMWDGTCQEQPLNSMCFEILGYDILIDEKLKPWLIEINHAPSFGTDTCLDFKIKKDLLADTLQLLSMSHSRKRDFQRQHRHYIQKRMLSYGRSKYAAYPSNKQNSFRQKNSVSNFNGLFGSPGGQQSSLNPGGGDYINNSYVGAQGRRRDHSFSNATSTTTATNAVNVDELEKELFGKHTRTTNQKAAGTAKQSIVATGSKGGGTILNTQEKVKENGLEEVAEGVSKKEAARTRTEVKGGEEGDDCSESSDERVEGEEGLEVEEAAEEEPEVKVRENQYKLIYPSRDNTEDEYRQYMQYANQLYEQFTGSYSKKQSRVDIQPLSMESKTSHYGSPSPIKHQSASQQPKLAQQQSVNRNLSSNEKQAATSQLSSIAQAQKDFLAAHNDLLLEVGRRNGQPNVNQYQYMDIKEHAQQSSSAAVDRPPSFLVGAWPSNGATRLANTDSGASAAQMQSTILQRSPNTDAKAAAQYSAQQANKGLIFPIDSGSMQHLGSAASYAEKMTAAVTGTTQTNHHPDRQALAQSVSRQQTAEMQGEKPNQRWNDAQQLTASSLSHMPQGDRHAEIKATQFNQTYTERPESSRDFVLQRFHNAPNNPSSLVSPLSVAHGRQLKGAVPANGSQMKTTSSTTGGGHAEAASPEPRLQNQQYPLSHQLQATSTPGTLNLTKIEKGKESHKTPTNPVDSHGYSNESWHASSAHASQAPWKNTLGAAFAVHKRNQLNPHTVEKNLSEPTPGEIGRGPHKEVIHIENQRLTAQYPGFLMTQKQHSQGKNAFQEAEHANRSANPGKSPATSSGEANQQRVAQSSIQQIIQRSQNAKSVMSSQEDGGGAATKLTHSLAATSATNKINAVNPKIAFASPQAAARLKQNKTISAERGVAPGDIVMQMSSPPTKAAATDSKAEAKKDDLDAGQGPTDREWRGQNLQPKLQLRRLDYVDRPSMVVQQGTFEINSARKAEALKGREGVSKCNTGLLEATRGGRSLESPTAHDGHQQSLSCQPSTSRLARGAAEGRADPHGLHVPGVSTANKLGDPSPLKSLPSSEAKRLREQPNEYLKNSNIANRAAQRVGVAETMYDHAQAGLRYPKSFSVKAKSNAGEPREGAVDLRPQHLGGAQAQSIGGMRPQVQHGVQHGPQSLYNGLDTFKDISGSLYALKAPPNGNGQQNVGPSPGLPGGRIDSERQPNGAAHAANATRSGNSRLFSNYVRDFIQEQKQLTQGRQAVSLAPQDPAKATLLSSIHEQQQVLQGKASHLGYFGGIGAPQSQLLGAAEARDRQYPRQSSLTHNVQLQRPHQFKPGGDSAKSSLPTQVFHKDYRNENAFLNRMKLVPHGTPGAAAIGNLFMAGAGSRKLAASSQDHAGFQKRDNSVASFLFASHQHAGIHPSSSLKHSSKMAPGLSSFLLNEQQQAYQSHIQPFHSHGVTLVHARHPKKRTLNIKQS